jgi:hypothetical protein
MLASVDPADAGVASGAVNSLREIAGALGIAVLAWVFTTSGGAAGASAYVSGLAPALFIGAGVLASGVLAIRRLPVGGHTADRAPLVIAADGIAASDPAQSGDHVPSRRSGRPPPEQSGGQPGVESGSGARGAPDDTWGPRHAGWAAAQGRMTALSTNTVRVFRHTRARPASGRRATLALLTWPRRHQGAGMGLRGWRPAPVDRSRPRFVDIEQSSKQSHDDGVDAVSGVGSRRTPAS